MSNVNGIIGALVNRNSLTGPDAKANGGDAGSFGDERDAPFDAMLNGLAQRGKTESAGSPEGALIGVKSSLDKTLQISRQAPPQNHAQPNYPTAARVADVALSSVEGSGDRFTFEAHGQFPGSTRGAAAPNAGLAVASAPQGAIAAVTNSAAAVPPVDNEAVIDVGTTRAPPSVSGEGPLQPKPLANSKSQPLATRPVSAAKQDGADQSSGSESAASVNDAIVSPTPGQSVISRLMQGFRQASGAASGATKSGESKHPVRTNDDRSSSADGSSVPPNNSFVPIAVPIMAAFSAATAGSSAGAELSTPAGASIQPTVATAPTTLMQAESDADILAPLSPHHGFAGDSSETSVRNMKIDVVSQATHFAPVARLSPTQQIIAAIVPFLGAQGLSPQQASVEAGPDVEASASPPAPQMVMSTTHFAQPALKTLDLTLEPADLGSVSVRLSLSSDGLAVEVQASQPATAGLMDKDKKSLSDALASAGYNVTGVDIRFAPTPSGTDAGQNASQSPAGQSFGGSQGNAGSQPQNGGAQGQPSRQYQQQNNNDPFEQVRPGARRSGGGGLYI